MSKIALVGLGLVGRAWAISFARAGHEVALWDERPEAIGETLTFANKVLPELDAQGLLDGEPALSVRGRLRRAGSLEEALEGAAHVQESAPEDVEAKREIFVRLDRAAEAETVLASPISSRPSRSCLRHGPTRASSSARRPSSARPVTRRS
jgi:L-gulonate 3-dehydrogenase